MSGQTGSRQAAELCFRDADCSPSAHVPVQVAQHVLFFLRSARLVAPTGTDRIVLVPNPGAAGTTAAAAAPCPSPPRQDVQMTDRARTNADGTANAADMAANGHWHSPSRRMAITDDVVFQQETETAPALRKMLAPLLEGRDELPRQHVFLFHPFLCDGCSLCGGQWTEENWMENVIRLMDVVDGGMPACNVVLEVAWAAAEKWIDLDMSADHDAVPATVWSRLNTVGRYGGDGKDGPENSGTHTFRRNFDGCKIALKRHLPFLFLMNFDSENAISC